MYKPLDTLECIKNLLLKQVVFMLGEKTVRRGKLILFTHDEYYVKFMLQTNKNINKNYEIPYPYRVLHGDDFVKFSYTISDLCKENEKKIEFVEQNTSIENVNKLHDMLLTISIIEQ